MPRLKGTLRLGGGGRKPDAPPPPAPGFQYIDPAFAPRWGLRSHYIEPWRSFLETAAAIDVINGLGINVNSTQTQTPFVMQGLAKKGFKRVRIEPGWNALKYAMPSGKEAEDIEKAGIGYSAFFTTNGWANLRVQLEGCRDNGLRPLLLLNANHGDPCPSTSVSTIKTTAAGKVFYKVTITATGGTFKLAWNGLKTAALPAAASVEEVKSALEALTGLAGNIEVIGEAKNFQVRLTNAQLEAQKAITIDAAALTGGTGAVASLGDQTLNLDPSTTAAIVPGKTGINVAGVKNFCTITAVAEDGTATLSQPLKWGVGIGTLKNVFTLLYAPFRPASNPAYEANPAFEETMLGWLQYARVIAGAAKEILGTEAFDLEVWNELSFGSNFLSINNYYKPQLEDGSGRTNAAIWCRTLAHIRSLYPNVGVCNGFNNQNNTVTGGAGATASDRHPYPGQEIFPGNDKGIQLDADGVGAYKKVGVENVPLFVPEYTLLCPETPFLYVHTENKLLDTAPWISYIPDKPSGEPHGRNSLCGIEPLPRSVDGGLTAAGYGKPVSPGITGPVKLYITETNMGSWAKFVPGITYEEKLHLETKVILRSIIAYLTKGTGALYFYAAGTGKADDLAMIDTAFFTAIAAKAQYPGDAALGEVILSVGRLIEALKGAATIAKPANVTLDDLGDYAGNIQFEGASEAIINPQTGEPANFPDKTNKDCFFFAPIQVDDSRRFVCSYYVVTKNVAHDYGKVSGSRRFDLPDEKYRMTIGGVKGTGATVSAIDPTTGAASSVTVVSSGANQLVVDVQATDYPRLLTIQEN